MTKTVEQLQRETAVLEGERNTWRQIAQELIAKQQLAVPQLQPLRVEPIVIPMYPQWAPPASQPYQPTPWWGTTDITFTAIGNTTGCAITAGDPDCHVTVEELRAHLDNHN